MKIPIEIPTTPEDLTRCAEELRDAAWEMSAAALSPTYRADSGHYEGPAYRFEKIAKTAAKVPGLVRKKHLPEARATYARARAGWLTEAPTFAKLRAEEVERDEMRRRLASIMQTPSRQPNTGR